jgi:hypothetical protein
MIMKSEMFLPASIVALPACILGLLLIGQFQLATAQILVRTHLPECSPPDTPQILFVEVRLEPGDSLKVYDVRLRFDTTRVILNESQIQQGSWFSNAGETFFWYEYQSGELIVNGAIMGPGLAVTGSGTIFSIPLEFPEEGITAADISLADLFNAQAQPYTAVITVPTTVQVPCPD